MKVIRLYVWTYIFLCLGEPRRPVHNQNGGILTSWNHTTSKADFVVAKDGSGTHRTINEAMAALSKLGNRRTRRIILYIKAGVYDEKVEVDHHIKNVMFVGDGIDKTIITGSRNVPDGYSTLNSATFGKINRNRVLICIVGNEVRQLINTNTILKCC